MKTCAPPWSFPVIVMPESYRLPDGSVIVNVHDIGRCMGRHCVIHNPSAHHMRNWPIEWRNDDKMFERRCPHGVWHPDPDDYAYLIAIGESERMAHGCDGCCYDNTIDGEVVIRQIEPRPPTGYRRL